MRIPHKIDKSTYSAYEASPSSADLAGEVGRQILAEDFVWDRNLCPSLATFCLEVIKSKFAENPLLDELPCEDRDYILEILDLSLPLHIVVPLIEDEVYWQTRYLEKYSTAIYRKRETWDWKTLYIERHIQDVIEHAQPEHNDEDELDELLDLCNPYVRVLNVSQLQAWKPPLHWDEEDIPEFYPTDHISFEPIFRKLTEIEEFDLIYGMNNVGDTFSWHMFTLSVGDCQRLGRSFHYLKYLQILRIHRSKLEDDHVRGLMHGLIRNETIEELDLSHCHIGDQGALCIAKVLSVHPKLRTLILCNNKIGRLGCEGLGFVLLNSGCMLEKLCLKLNPLREGGAMGIMRALVRGTKLLDLSMAACQFDENAPLRTGQMLLLNKSLKRLDVSNNWFDEQGGKALIDGLAINRTLEWLDIRETDISTDQQNKIRQCLQRNKLDKDGEDEHEEEDVPIEQQADAASGSINASNTTQQTDETASVID